MNFNGALHNDVIKVYNLNPANNKPYNLFGGPIGMSTDPYDDRKLASFNEEGMPIEIPTPVSVSTLKGFDPIKHGSTELGKRILTLLTDPEAGFFAVRGIGDTRGVPQSSVIWRDIRDKYKITDPDPNLIADKIKELEAAGHVVGDDEFNLFARFKPIERMNSSRFKEYLQDVLNRDKSFGRKVQLIMNRGHV